MGMFSVKDKTIVITGATGVLGETMAKHLANEGARVLVIGRTPNKIETLANAILAEGGYAEGYIADVTVESQVEFVASAIGEKHGFIDVLVNLAGGNMPEAIVGPTQMLTDLSTEAVKKVMDLNYQGTLIPIKCLFPLMLGQKAGNIINISSMAATRPMTRVVGYASAKAAIDNLTKWLAVEFAQKHGEGFRVNAIAPGFFLTEQNRSLLTKEDGSLTERGEKIIAHTPMNRFGKPDDLLGVLQWLCSDASRFVSGTTIPIDGGFSAYSGV